MDGVNVNGRPTSIGGSNRQHHPQYLNVDPASKVSINGEDIPSLDVSTSALPPFWATGIRIGATLSMGVTGYKQNGGRLS